MEGGSSSPTRQGPNADFAGAALTQGVRTGGGGGSGGQDVVNQNDLFAAQRFGARIGKGVGHVCRAGGSGEDGLSIGWFDAADEVRVDGNTSGVAEVLAEPGGLVEFAFALLGGMQRNGRDEIPFFGAEGRGGFANEEVGEERLEPEGSVVFIAVNDIEDELVGADGGASAGEGPGHVFAVLALKLGRGDVAVVGQAALLAEGRRDKPNAAPTIGANVALGSRGALFAADLANRWIDEIEGGVKHRVGKMANGSSEIAQPTGGGG